MNFDLEKIRDIASTLYLPVIAREYGETGVHALKEVMRKLREIFSFLEPEIIQGTLIVFKRIESDEPLPDLPNSRAISDSRYLPLEVDISVGSTSLIQIREDGTLLVWRDTAPDLAKLRDLAVVYSYRGGREYFFARATECVVPNPSPVHASIFSIPTFRELKSALEDYRVRSIRTSSCRIFSEVWHGGPLSARLFLKSAPESTIRDSLAQFLRNVLRGAEVRPEQNVDDSHPIDIKVTWMLTNRQALIEIKWLGKSLSESGRVTASYSDSQVLKGANQLAQYLDWNRRQVPAHQVVGYLVVVDARRNGLKTTSVSIGRHDGMYYEHTEIAYDPCFHLTRLDFAEPIRMFAEPVCI